MPGQGQPEQESPAASKARELLEEGLSVIPLGAPGEPPPPWLIERCNGDAVEAAERWPKTPQLKEWKPFQHAQPSTEQFEAWVARFPRANWAVLTGKLVVVDADSPEAVAWCESGAITRSPRKVITAKGAHFYYAENPALPVRNTTNPTGKIDTRGHGGYVVAPESIHGTGAIYTEECLPGWGDTSLTELPRLTADDLKAIRTFNGSSVAPNGQTLFSGPGNLQFDATRVPPARPPDPDHVRDLRAALTHLDPDASYEQWVQVGMALHGLDDGDGLELWDAWSRGGAKYKPGETAQKWQSFSRGAGGVTWKSIFRWAADAGWRNPGRGYGEEEQLEAPAEVTRTLPTRTSVARWASMEPKPRRWLWENWIPARQSTGLYASGGTGKTLLVQQLATAVATGSPLLKRHEVAHGPVVGVFCEDDDEELHRRQHAINTMLDVSYDALSGFHGVSRIGQDNILMTFRNGKGELTPFWHELSTMIGDIKPVLTIVDTAADTFAGNELDRGQVRQFIQGALTRLAVEHDTAVLLCAHPSKSGAQTKGASGSTAWENTLRSRLYLHQDEISQMRTLSREKSNYSARGEEVEFYWQSGAFAPAAEVQLDLQIDQIHQSQFLKLLDRFTEQSNYPSASRNSQMYAPKAFAKYASSVRGYKGATVENLERAMHQLLEDNLIKIESDPRNKVTSRISRIDEND